MRNPQSTDGITQVVVRLLTRRCAWCGRTDGTDYGEYTDGICRACLRRVDPKHAEAIIADAVAAGQPLL